MAGITNSSGAYMLIQRNNFQGNGNCDATREANKRAARATGMESEIAPYYGPTGTATATAGMPGTAGMTGTADMTSAADTADMAATAAAEAQAVGSSTAQRQMAARNAAQDSAASSGTAGSGAGSDLINDGYGTEYVHTLEEEEGMSSFPQDSFTEPLSALEAARNSWRALLARNVGRNVLVRFLVGTQNITTVEGELYEVGTDYIVIYQPLWDSHITADLYMVKFVEFREPTGVMTLD